VALNWQLCLWTNDRRLNHKSVDPAGLQDGLLRAGEEAEAEKVLLERLADPVTRGAALVEMQTYFERPRPPLDAVWHSREVKLARSTGVQELIARVGLIERYAWRSPD
jgi:hypothetical protein